MIALADLNVLSATDFTAALAHVFEHSPWIAERAATKRPFASRLALHAAMCEVVQQASTAEQLDLVRAHPELAGRAAVRNELTADSTREQRGIGLDACTPDEFARLHDLNRRYNEKFGFPFILAVRGHDRASVIAAFGTRLDSGIDEELHTALKQIERIAFFRLNETVDAPLGTELIAMHEVLAQYSDDDSGSLTCTYLRPAHIATAKWIRDFMLAANLDVEIDAVGNVVGRWRSGSPAARTLITGSHYDTVTDAGKYDGRLGVLLPIAVVQRLRGAGTKLPYDLEIVAFAEEEGVRFKSTFLGSSAIAGSFDRGVLDLIDSDGVSLREAMLAAGHDPQTIDAVARDPRRVAGYVEVHIEQGPVLLDAGRALGVVTAIAGSVRSIVTIVGLAGHAGTVPMGLRRDAAAAAAEIVLAVEKYCSTAAGLVGTVGRLEVPHGAINVIPGRCELSIDIRAGDDSVRDAAEAEVLAEIERIAARRKVKIDVRRVLRAAGAPCADAMQDQLASAITRIANDAAPLRLPSGAGHDAMKMATITPIGMLFVRCGNGGISHNPAETMTADDADVAARVFTDFLIHFKPVSA